ncbi:serine/threonine-protein kinase SMG1-like, partial [Anneissia japonica]|uniref:serine/threonine-protein kinase SMG1-like n=1 Tax=Anneissia japonica TaxID=1529436 RepID=UPI0014258F8A
ALFDEVLQKVVSALIMVHCPDTITGLVQWSSNFTAKPYAWTNACTVHAEGKYELAALEYMDSLRRYLQVDDQVNEVMMCRFPRLLDLTSGIANSSRNMKGEDTQPKKILTRLADSPVPNQVVIEFMIKQVGGCYSELCDWQSVLKWQEMVNDFHHLMPSHVNDSSVYQLPDVNVIKALSK